MCSQHFYKKYFTDLAECCQKAKNEDFISALVCTFFIFFVIDIACLE